MTTSPSRDLTLDDLIEREYRTRTVRGRRQRRGRQLYTGARVAGRASRRGAFRWRYQLAPLWLLAAVATAGSLLRLTPTPGRATALLCAVAAGLWWWWARRVEKPGRRRYGWAIVAFVCTWLLALAAFGWGVEVAGRRPMAAVLLLGGCALAVPWWRHYRIRPVEDEPEPDVRALTLADEWHEYVAPQGQPCPGSRVTAIEQTPRAIEMEVVLARGKQTVKQAIAATEQIEGALEQTTGSVAVEQSRTNIANRVRVTLITGKNPLHDVVPWRGPEGIDWRAGKAPIGIYADEELVMYRFFRPGSGPSHDLISGSSDSGKSRVLDLLLALERHSGFIGSIVIDPQYGQSVPDWKRNVGAFASGPKEGLEMLERVHAEMFARNLLLSDVEWEDEQGRQRQGVDHFDPFHPAILKLGLKLWCITTDEAHMLLKNKLAATLTAELVNMARKCGLKKRLVTQVPLLGSLGNRMEIRDAVAAGNVICLRTANALTGQVAFNGAIPVQPHRLPREWPNGKTTAGIGFSLGASSRSAMMRIALVEDSFGWANSGETTQLDWLTEPKNRTKKVVATPPPAAVAGAVDLQHHAAVTAALRGGARLVGQIVAACPGTSLTDVRTTLDQLVNAGTAKQVGTREYELT